MPKILMSACLLGHKVRYDGGDCLQHHERLKVYFDQGSIITICPEVSGGLATPRLPAEIQGAKTGLDVLNQKAKVQANNGDDVTPAFLQGAQKALALVKKHNIRVAILKAKSPSCGSGFIYDGTFSKHLIPGSGVTSALLQEEGVLVFDENHIDEALDALE
jgi:uncharacterized protein YbbK (DUF523 family)